MENTITLQAIASAKGVSRERIRQLANKFGVATIKTPRGYRHLLLSDAKRVWPDLFTPEAHASREIAHVIDAVELQARSSGAMSTDQFAHELRNALAAMITDDGRFLRLFVGAIGGGPQFIERGLERVTAMLKGEV